MQSNWTTMEPRLSRRRLRRPAPEEPAGQLTQAANATFLGWIRGRGEERRLFYWHQPRDVNGWADLELSAGLGRMEPISGLISAQGEARIQALPLSKLRDSTHSFGTSRATSHRPRRGGPSGVPPQPPW